MVTDSVLQASKDYRLEGAHGIVVVLGTVVILEILRQAGLAAPNPQLFTAVAVTYAAYVGGYGGGLIGAFIGVAYAFYFFSSPEGIFHYTPVTSKKVAVNLITLPAIALLVSNLNRRLAKSLHGRGQRFMDTANAPIMGIDKEGRIKVWNKKIAQLTGWALSELNDRQMVELLSNGEQESTFKVAIDAALDGHETSSFELSLASKNGGSVDFLAAFSPEYDLRGNVIGAVAVGQDITERKKAEAELAEKSALLGTTLENMSHGITVLDADLKLLAFNQKSVELRDCPQGLLRVGMPIEEFYRYKAERGYYGPGDVDAQVAAQSERKRRIKRNRQERVRSDGKVVAIHSEPMPDGGQVTTYTDITERKKAEAELAEKSALLEGTFQNMVQGIAVYGADHTLVSFNPQYADIMGLPSDYLHTGINRRDIFRYRAEQGHFDDADADAEIEERLASTKQPESSERTLPNGRSYSYELTPMPDGGYIITLTDTTERRVAEERLREAQKMEALGQLTGGVAHEFNNLLQAVMGNLDLLKDDLKGMEKPRERAERIMKAAMRGKELTHSLLSYTGKQITLPHMIDTGDFIENMVSLLRPILGEGIEVESKVADHLWPVSVDPGQLQSALLNIAVNARDAMPDGGKVMIETANIGVTEVMAAKHPYKVTPGDYVMISIADTGTGMPDEVKEHIFDPFFTTKGMAEGTGLGLSMVFGFIRKQSGGFIDIDSAVGRGTTVKLYLPRVAAVVNEEETPTPQERPRGDKAVILVVEDEVEVLKVTAEALERLGYTVLQAETGDDALALAEEAGHIDLLLSDITLRGGMSGPEVANTLRQARPDQKVIFMSGHTDKTIEANGDMDTLLLRKPFPLPDLLMAVANALEDTDGQGTASSNRRN